MFAKLLGVLYKKKSIGFISLPIFNDNFLEIFGFSEEDASNMVNIYTLNGMFSKQDSSGTNIGIPSEIFIMKKAEGFFHSERAVNGVAFFF